MGKEDEAFVLHMASLAFVIGMTIHPSRIAQIASLIAEKVPVIVLAEYPDFVDVFSPESATELPEHTEINDYSIELIDN